MALFSSKTQDTLTLIIHVQSSLVRGSLIRNRTGVLPEIIFSHSILIPFKSVSNSAYLIRMALHGTAEIVAATLQYASIHSALEGKEGLPKRINSVHFVLSSPWIISQAKILSVTFSRPTIVSKALVKKMVDAERDKLMPKSADNFSIIEQKISDVQLNGYSVHDWEGKEATDVSIPYVMSIAGTAMLDELRKVCELVARDRHVMFHSSMLLEHIGIEQCVSGLSSYLLIHVHGELTDVVVVEHGTCVFFGSYPYGVYTAVRRLCLTQKIGEQAADSLLTLSIKDQLDASRTPSTSTAVSGLQKDWSDQFTKLFKSVSYIPQLPRVAFIFARYHHEFFTEGFAAAYPLIKVKPLGVDDISSKIVYEKHLEERTVVTGLTALAIHSMEK